MGEILDGTQGVKPTFLNLKNQLATMYGASAVSDLQTVDQERVGIYVNQAYRECYSPMDGKRPAWAKIHFGLDLPAPNSLNLTVTDGSKSATSDESLASYVDYEGSFIKVDGKWYTVAYMSGTDVELVEPWEGSSGAKTAIMYHSSHRMDREVIDVDMVPEILGKGLMSPMASPEVATRVRSKYTHDFLPGRSWGKLPSIRNNSEELEIDTPVFYFIDNSALRIPTNTGVDAGLQSASEMAVRPRFNVYPLPDKDYSVRGTANILPHEMGSDGDIARLPGNVVWDILFPIACAKLALSDPRYNGDNREAVQRSAEEARVRLKTFAQAQKHRNMRMVKRSGY